MTPSPEPGRFRYDRRFTPPLFITAILLAGHLSFGILEGYELTLLAIAAAILAELLLSRALRGEWPHLASAYITGISVGILIRSPFVWPFVLGSLISISSKYALRYRGRHLWNPSNFGISALLFLAPASVAHLSIQWGNNLWPMLVIWVLGSVIIWRLRRFHVCAAYVISFIVLAWVRTLITGDAFLAELAPITGPMYQLIVFFMITDPKTTVSSRTGRMAVAVLIAVVEMFFRLGDVVHAPFYALFIVGPLALLAEIWWSQAQRRGAPENRAQSKWGLPPTKTPGALPKERLHHTLTVPLRQRARSVFRRLCGTPIFKPIDDLPPVPMKRLLWLSAIIVSTGCGAGERIDNAYPQDDLTSWSHYLGDPGRTHFSSLSQIDSTNVGELEIAWTFAAGGLAPGANTEIQHNPLIVDSVLYGRSPDMDVFAIGADSGELLWRVELQPEGPGYFGKARGLMRWVSDTGESERLYAGSGFHLYSIDPTTGTLDPTFGDGGRIDLRAGLDRDPETILVGMNTPGAVFEDLLIVGGRVDEFPGAAPGHIRAYDARTGETQWVFHTLPHPGEFGYDTWPDGAYETAGAANSWAGMSVDLQRGIVFVPTGSASWDYYGADRPGDNLFANTLLALNARTGERIWHQQLVRHDLWDRDLPAPPNLVMVERDGKLVPAVAQITKDAHVWVFHRETGEPLFPIREVEVPLSELVGEWTSPTQRLPELPAPFARQRVTPEELYRPDVQIRVERLGQSERELPGQTVGEFLTSVSSRGQFDPPSLQGSIIFPGLDGGGEWGGAAVDPRKGFMYVNGSEMAWIAGFEPVDPGAQPAETLFGLYCMRCHAGAASIGPDLSGIGDRLSADSVAAVIRGGRNAMPANPQLSTSELDDIVSWLLGQAQADQDHEPATRYPYQLHRWGRLLDEFEKPIIRPPWGLLTAIDLNSGEHLWQVPLGNDEDIDDPAYPITGIENYGGPVVTAGGVVFIAATKDEKIRAFNAASGEQLWEADLPAGGYATPATYAWGGRQYVVIAAGGGKMGTPSGDQYVAFALPR